MIGTPGTAGRLRHLPFKFQKPNKRRAGIVAHVESSAFSRNNDIAVLRLTELALAVNSIRR